MTALPQHMQALARAEQIKAAKGQFSRAVRALPSGAGARKVAHAIEHEHDDPIIGRLRIRSMLSRIKYMGDQKVAKCLVAAGVVNGDRRLNELTERQRGALVIQLELWAETWSR